MSYLAEQYVVLVRLPDPSGTLTPVIVTAMDMYKAAEIAESMTGGKSLGAVRKPS